MKEKHSRQIEVTVLGIWGEGLVDVAPTETPMF